MKVFSLYALILGLVMACDAFDYEAKEFENLEKKHTVDRAESDRILANMLAIRDLDKNAVSVTGLMNNMSAVADAAVPGALAIDPSLRLRSADDPCMDTNNLVECRVLQVPYYLDQVHKFLVSIKDTDSDDSPLNNTNKLLLLFDVRVKDRTNLPQAETNKQLSPIIDFMLPKKLRLSTLDYLVTTTDKSSKDDATLLFEILLKNSDKEPYGYIYTDEGKTAPDGVEYKAHYQIVVSGEEAKVENADESTLAFAHLYFTDNDNFYLDARFTSVPCAKNNPSIPENAITRIKLADGVWSANFSIYVPRVTGLNGDSNSCDVTDAAARSVFYLDVTANATKSAGAVYSVPPSTTATSAITDYPISSHCSTFPSQCVSGALGDESITAAYHYYCDVGGTVTWSASTHGCSDLTIGTFDSSEWMAPVDVVNLTNEKIAQKLPNNL